MDGDGGGGGAGESSNGLSGRGGFPLEDIPVLIAKSIHPKADEIEINHAIGPVNSKCVHVCPVTCQPCGCGSSMQFEFKHCGDHSQDFQNLEGKRGIFFKRITVVYFVHFCLMIY